MSGKHVCILLTQAFLIKSCSKASMTTKKTLSTLHLRLSTTIPRRTPISHKFCWILLRNHVGFCSPVLKNDHYCTKLKRLCWKVFCWRRSPGFKDRAQARLRLRSPKLGSVVQTLGGGGDRQWITLCHSRAWVPGARGLPTTGHCVPSWAKGKAPTSFTLSLVRSSPAPRSILEISGPGESSGVGTRGKIVSQP